MCDLVLWERIFFYTTKLIMRYTYDILKINLPQLEIV